jgi:hypothetical protein
LALPDAELLQCPSEKALLVLAHGETRGLLCESENRPSPVTGESMRRFPANPLVLLLSIWGWVACSSSEAPNTALSLAPIYHLKTVDGVLLPIPIPSSDGASLDSGHVRRLGGDTVRVDHFTDSHPSGNNPGIVVVSVGTWAATRFGNTVVLFPILANSLDTAFVGAGDTLTLHSRAGGALHVEVYVAP